MGLKLVDGPGRCAGRLEILRGEESFPVAESESTNTSLPVLCNLLGCGNNNRKEKENFSPGSRQFFRWEVNCGSEAKSISDCVQPNPMRITEQSKALMLACEGEHASH